MAAASKREFVLEHLSKLPAEVCKLAKRDGIVITPQYVSKIRSEFKKKPYFAERVETFKPIQLDESDKRVQLRKLVLQVGIDAAQRVLDEVREACHA